eukprot:TRINITY_DN62310_c0_g1_i1.p1 TRINITY_DN62310_c0_g1~~TRINITY_DN62310_c0_g1_i1.p1  ORF type:complete len:346 (-),score=38.91 TRINITY_DN62310_c0_g1_i1:262-1299(-)
MKALKGFDLYRKVPRDLTEPTVSGACVSCCTVSVACYLFVTELLVFLQRPWESQMLIEPSKTEEKIQINLDITMPYLPCEILSFDAQDVMGSHEVDAHGNLYKERLTSKGDVIAKEEMKSSHHGTSAGLTRYVSFGFDNADVDRIRKMIHSGEGCRVSGYVTVNKVPGNVHLSTYSHSFIFGSLYQESKNINITHTINHISFGVDKDIHYVKDNFKGTGIVSPLDGLVQIAPERKTSQDASLIYEYYSKVVPTSYVPLESSPIHVYQFTANTNRIANQQMPSLYLRYDFSPVTIKYTEVRQSISHFVVQICAVIGGVFTVAGLVDSFIHKGIVHLARKAQIGKLG